MRSKAMTDQGLTPFDDRSLDRLRERTPARLLVGRAGTGYRTATHLALRLDHAAARDAVQREIDLAASDLATTMNLTRPVLALQSAARTKAEYLLRPDLGRRLDGPSREGLEQRACGKPAVDIQFVVGDGLSPAAVMRQVPVLLPLLFAAAEAKGWTTGEPIFVRYARVGIMNELGDVLRCRLIVLLVGERPGLATDESLSAYMAFGPKSGQTDADRNLISNIHPAGVPPCAAAPRIVALAQKMFVGQTSGTAIKEDLPGERLGFVSERRLE